LTEGNSTPGYHKAAFIIEDNNRHALATGTYFCRIQANGSDKTVSVYMSH
jgi:hypothetical protein